MPYTIVRTNGQYCVYKEDASGAATGESLGCHDTRDGAAGQIGAIEASETKNVPDKYSHIDFTPTEGMREAARNGLERHERGETGDGLKPETVRRANQIADGEALTPSHVREMNGWFARHGENRQDPGTPWYAAWQLWGGDPGERWSGARVRQMDAADNADGKTLRGQPMTIAKSYIPGYAAGTTLKNCANCAAFQRGICAMYNVPVAPRGYCPDWQGAGMPDTPDGYEDAIDAYERGEMKVHGGALQVKAVTADTVTVAGYGVLFGGTDLDGDTFTKNTAFALERMKRVPVFFDHAMDEDLDDTPLGYIKEMHEDDTGLWVEAQLNRNQRYTQAVMQLIEGKAVGWSSGSVPHLVRRDGGAIRSWPIVEFSLTPTPAESRLSGAVSAKGTDPASPVDINSTLETTKDIDMTEEQLQALLEQAAAKAVTSAMKTPAERQAEDQPVKADPMLEELKAQNAHLNQQMADVMKLLDSEKAQSIGYVTPDGGGNDRDVKSFGDFLLAINRKDTKRLHEVYGSRKSHDTTKGMVEHTGADGGYIVPPQFVNRLMELTVEMAVVRPRAFTLPMTGKEALLPAIDYSGDYTAGTTQMLGGVIMRWTGEAQTIQETQPKLRRANLQNHKLSGTVPVSNELLADNAAGLEALLMRLFGQAIVFAEDYAFLVGDGVGKPLGVVNAPATITTETALTASAVTVAQVTKMYKRLMPSCRGTAVWVINTLLHDALQNINSTGTNVLTYLPDLNGRIQPRLLGLPVLETEKLPTTFANGGLILADFQQYVIGDRVQLEIAMSEHSSFTTDETDWRVISRTGGMPWMNSAVAIGEGTNDTVSAFVKSK